MLPEHNRAFKEWALVCEALKNGRQTVLIRKGGIREEDGQFRIKDSEFFLMPTYEHQNPELLQPEFVPLLQEIVTHPHDLKSIAIDAYTVVDTITVCDDEDRLSRLSCEHIWNDRYLRMRLDFNPYDPLYVLLLRVYRLPNILTIPMRPEYEGCKSWVTLEKQVSTAGASPAIPDAEFEARKARILEILDIAG
jgi:hypothetical protein